MGVASYLTVQTHGADPGKRMLLRVLKVTIQRTGGTATVYDPSLASDPAGFDTYQEAWASDTTPPIATVFQKDFVADGLVMLSDTLGNIYLKPGWDAGADNACTARVFIEKLRIIGA